MKIYILIPLLFNLITSVIAEKRKLIEHQIYARDVSKNEPTDSTMHVIDRLCQNNKTIPLDLNSI